MAPSANWRWIAFADVVCGAARGVDLFSLVEETARDIIGHDCDPIDNIPRRNYIARQYLWPHQLSVKQTAVFVPAVFSRALFVANFIHRDEGIAARFPFDAARAFRFRHTAEA